jgi:hypothetical protein
VEFEENATGSTEITTGTSVNTWPAPTSTVRSAKGTERLTHHRTASDSISLPTGHATAPSLHNHWRAKHVLSCAHETWEGTEEGDGVAQNTLSESIQLLARASSRIASGSGHESVCALLLSNGADAEGLDSVQTTSGL